MIVCNMKIPFVNSEEYAVEGTSEGCMANEKRSYK